MKRKRTRVQLVLSSGADAEGGGDGCSAAQSIPSDVIKGAALGMPDPEWRTARCGTAADISNDVQIIDTCFALGAPNMSAWCIFAELTSDQIRNLVREYAA